jgi:opacity protein-like surface antigen
MKRAGLVFAVVGLACWAHAQTLGFELRLGAAGVFNKTSTSSDGTRTLTPTNSLEILGSIRWRFSRIHSLELNLGHTYNSEIYAVPPDSFRIAASVFEYSGAYLFSPFSTKKFEPFVFAGGGALRFSPQSTLIDGNTASLGAASQTSLAFLYGGGTEYRLWRVFRLRAEYRGLLYRNPDFTISRLFTGSRGHMAEPSLAVVAKF